MFPSRFVFIGLLPPPENGVCNITGMYLARYGALAAYEDHRSGRFVAGRVVQWMN